LKRFLAESCERIDRYLDRFLPPEEEPPRLLHQAMRYAVLPGGKRLRPAIAFGAALACGKDADSVLPVAAAAELVHAYSLVHDDLPAMDDDEERRGRPTVHVRFGEATAILAGDALLAEAFRCLSAARVPIGVVELLAETVSSRALVGGQAEDLAFRAPEATEEMLTRIHERKTAALFEFAAVGAARELSAPPDTEARLSRYARSYGLAFQLADDLLDAGARGCSALGVMSADAARRRLEGHVAEAVQALEALSPRAEALRALAVELPLRLR
jgi:geranylgeranyl pyrophosphate synthase